MTYIAREGLLRDNGEGEKLFYGITWDEWGFSFEFDCRGINQTVFGPDLHLLYNFYRSLGEVLEVAQPGLTCPLPDNSPDLVDALKVIDKADQLRKENK